MIKENRLAIKVPSVIVPEEYNIIVNPEHQDFERVQIKGVKTFEIDWRLIK